MSKKANFAFSELDSGNACDDYGRKSVKLD